MASVPGAARARAAGDVARDPAVGAPDALALDGQRVAGQLQEVARRRGRLAPLRGLDPGDAVVETVQFAHQNGMSSSAADGVATPAVTGGGLKPPVSMGTSSVP